MPTYEYRCSTCGHEMEAIQRISADALTTCPECGEEGLKRLISQTSFLLKGGGWYATDYAGKKTHDKASPSSAESSTPAAKPSSSGDGASSD